MQRTVIHFSKLLGCSFFSIESLSNLEANHLIFEGRGWGGGGWGWKISQWQEFFLPTDQQGRYFSVKKQCKKNFFGDNLLQDFFCTSGTAQPIAKQKKSYPKDSTDYGHWFHKKKVPADAILIYLLDVTSLYANIPKRREPKRYVLAEHAKHSSTLRKPPIPTPLLEKSPRLLISVCLQIYGLALGTKRAVMNKVETEILIQSAFQPLVRKRYIDDMFLL